MSIRALRQTAFNSIHALTHLAFAYFAFTGYVLITRTQFDPLLTIPPLLFGALLPDLDVSTSFVGRLFLPISRWLEARVGHRQEFHSLVGALVVGLLVSPLYLLSPQSWWATIGGFVSHLFLDMCQPQGVMWLWPVRVRFVLLGGRIEHQTPGEQILLAALLILSVLLFPLARANYGPIELLHHVFPNPRFAAQDYDDWRGKFQVWAEVTGFLRASSLPADGRYEVLDVVGTTFILRQGQAVYSAGDSQDTQIGLNAIRLERGDAITVESRELHLPNATFRDLLEQLPQDADVVLSGQFTSTSAIPPKSLVEMPRCTGGPEYQCRFLSPSDLQEMANMRASNIAFTVRIIRALSNVPRDSTPVPTRIAPRPTPVGGYGRVDIIISNVGDLSEIAVTLGDQITIGQVLADRATWRKELERDVQMARANLDLNSVRVPPPEAVNAAREMIKATDSKARAAEKEKANTSNIAALQVRIAETKRDFIQRWKKLLEDINKYDPWKDAPYLVGSQDGPQGKRSDLLLREAIEKARNDLTIAELELQIAKAQSDPTLAKLQLDAVLADLAAKRADAEKTIAEVERSETITNARVANYKAALEKAQAALDDALVRSLVSGTVTDVQIVQVAGNWATVRVVVDTSPTPRAVPSTSEDAHIVDIVDGDTLRVQIGSQVETVRLIGVDTPETKHPTKGVECYGPEATTAISRYRGQSVRIEYDAERTDKYGRTLAYVYLLADGTMLNEWLAVNGYAREMSIPPNTRYAARLHAGVEAARGGGIGLWSACR